MNTKTIKINREMPVDTNELCIRKAYLAEACRNLTPTGFALYIYLLSQATNQFDFSRADCTETMGVSPRSVTSAFVDLQKAGYLIDMGHNEYILNETREDK